MFPVFRKGNGNVFGARIQYRLNYLDRSRLTVTQRMEGPPPCGRCSSREQNILVVISNSPTI